MHRRTLVLAALFASHGCGDAAPSIETRSGTVVSDVKFVTGALSAQVGMQVISTDSSGLLSQCDASTKNVSLEVSFDGGPFQNIPKKQIEVTCGTRGIAHIGLVLDNSGSQEEVLELTRASAKQLAHDVIESGGKVGLIRVSTGAKQLVPVIDDVAALDEALDGLFVNAGWTALYDGIRMGHEALGTALASLPTSDTPLCAEVPKPALVVFSNGVDNNSADEQSPLDSDGMSTKFSDIVHLTMKGSKIPIFTLGLGDEVDHGALTSLAAHSGGKHLELSGPEALPEAFDLISQYSQNGVSVCAPLDSVGCGQATVRVKHQGETTEHEVYVPCETPPQTGRSVVVQLTLSNMGLPLATAGKLVTGAVDWVSPVQTPSVLVVRDDSHRDESSADPIYVGGILESLGYDVDHLDEPPAGLSVDDLEGYDVVWFSNPGWPVDDQASMEALLAHAAAGNGIVYSGDDASWSYGNGFSMLPYTHLEHESNGTVTCGTVTDGNAGGAYRVAFTHGDHPVTAGLAGAEFLYGDDIDHATLGNEAAQVLAWARLDGDDSCDVEVPVVIAYDPSDAQ